MKHYILPVFLSLLTISFWLGLAPVRAQQQQSNTYVESNLLQPYWKLKADYSDQKPVVQFYNNQHELLYQERLPGNSGRITKRTVRAFDVLLANLTTQKILATTYLSNNELMASTSPALPAIDEKRLGKVIFNEGMVVFSVEPAINQAGKLAIYFAQLTGRPVSVALENEERTLVYYEDFTKLAIYRRTVDLDQLPGGTYYLRIHSINELFVYRVTVDRILSRYYIHNQ